MSDLIERQAVIKSLMQFTEGKKTIGQCIDEVPSVHAEPCSDAISRAEAQTEIMMFAGNCKSDEEDIYIKVSDAVQLLRDLPSVHAEPRTGHWIRWYEVQKDETGDTYIPHCKCSECGKKYDPHTSQFMKFCANCGAKMEADNA